MEQRFSLITLGVRSVEASAAFFERLGWRRSVKAAEGVAFFQCGGVALSLYPRAELAADAGTEVDDGGASAFSIAYNTRSKDEVDAVLAEAEAAGARISRRGREMPWGGYSGFFRDLDGHLWEVAWNPGFPLGEDGQRQGRPQKCVKSDVAQTQLAQYIRQLRREGARHNAHARWDATSIEELDHVSHGVGRLPADAVGLSRPLSSRIGRQRCQDRALSKQGVPFSIVGDAQTVGEQRFDSVGEMLLESANQL